MTAPLIPDIAVKKAETAHSRSQLEHQQRVAKARAVEAAMNGINEATQLSVTRAKTQPAGPSNFLLLPDAPEPQPQANKRAPDDLHPRVKSLKVALSPDAARLLSLVVKADEAYRGARLIDLSRYSVKTALGISEDAAAKSRTELEARGLIVFRDSGSGDRGFYPRVP